MGFEHVPCPTSAFLEKLFYPSARTIAAAAYSMLNGGNNDWIPKQTDYPETIAFKGPF
jgi:hypothetical protein